MAGAREHTCPVKSTALHGPTDDGGDEDGDVIVVVGGGGGGEEGVMEREGMR